MDPWVVSYHPQAPEDIPQPEAVKQLKTFLNQFATQKKKAAFLYGPSGTGKTIAAHVLANQLNLEVVEINASDFRNTDQIKSRIGSAVQQRSLFSEGKLILVDEIDGISGRKDRGGVGALVDIIKKTTFPIIVTANNPFDSKFSKLRKASVMIEFPPVEPNAVFDILKNILEKEKIEFEEIAVKSLARRCGGDLRAAIIDLQVIGQPTGKITKAIMDELGHRDKTETMLNALTKILKQSDPHIAVSALDNTQEDLDAAMLWIEENVPKEYTKKADLNRAFNAISKADVFKGRIRRWQYWRFLVYVNVLLTAGVASAKDEPYRSQVQYAQTQRLLQKWILNRKYAIRGVIAEKVAEHMHCSKRRAIQDIIPFLRAMVKTDSKYAAGVIESLELDPEEVKWLQ